ncbi:MAG: 5-formyltetrahydrofolate cyclo-ligase [Candidatus Omnitrophota bacterium]|jgi:5-formyltetrahydrofolate cyclo-ligase
MLTKQAIRSKILLELENQEEESRKRKSSIIKNKLFRTKVFRKAKIVMFYIAFKGEVETEEMIKEALNLGKIVTVPVCKPHKLALEPCILDNHANLKRGPYGVKEPVEERCLPLSALQLVIVPGIAFDKKGNRLGRGKGYYDRLLQKLPRTIQSIGLAFDFQILSSVPSHAHDVAVGRVIFN